MAFAPDVQSEEVNGSNVTVDANGVTYGNLVGNDDFLNAGGVNNADYGIAGSGDIVTGQGDTFVDTNGGTPLTVQGGGNTTEVLASGRRNWRDTMPDQHRECFLSSSRAASITKCFLSKARRRRTRFCTAERKDCDRGHLRAAVRDAAPNHVDAGTGPKPFRLSDAIASRLVELWNARSKHARTSLKATDRMIGGRDASPGQSAEPTRAHDTLSCGACSAMKRKARAARADPDYAPAEAESGHLLS